MKVIDLLEHLERYAPLELAQSWDNVGLLIGEPQRRVNRVMISLDASANAVEYAIKEGYDLILSHHPLIFHPLKSITNPVILRMIESRIALISLHTNFDAALGGVNHALADELGLQVQGELGDVQANDIGLICSYEAAKTMQEIASVVKTRLAAPAVKLWTAGQKLNAKVKRIAICGGAGGSVLHLAEENADILITGDISYHSFLDSKIPILDAGHFYTEYPALGRLQENLQLTGLPSKILPKELHEYSQYMHFR
ncbi:MAG: Nif3-like dinuclear metal center hexameric protein [Candidatus Cloacimonadaceae bacterium]|nr:Nif3-like dinuclear metal center hexameric protein [Candidatus Cloacimonadota bacterium]MDY0126971.1 Nif3-like dinuclear metal center hexameric protein [Candidatus Cloacimonadaceae bacterium]MCB5255762.1 Nif3-like dinuclear metal center hexameric protein [Candidatus Cloacimonadota bacterium]MCK9178606.1 Nif3-like dinuclear metal center hexameric protein [Candidatus Cloacimonadota bacterium]MCK9242788.1 Nif3-like dinuclear metal center hexameric protein [Candidatus Cloacimonadota bacterium]